MDTVERNQEEQVIFAFLTLTDRLEKALGDTQELVALCEDQRLSSETRHILDKAYEVAELIGTLFAKNVRLRHKLRKQGFKGAEY